MTKKIVIGFLAGLVGIVVLLFVLFNALTNPETLGNTNPINNESTKQVEHKSNETTSNEQPNDNLLKETTKEIQPKPTVQKEVEQNASSNQQNQSLEQVEITETVSEEHICGLHDSIEEHIQETITGEDVLSALGNPPNVEDIRIDEREEKTILIVLLNVVSEEQETLEQMTIDIVDYYNGDYTTTWEDVFEEEVGNSRYFAPAEIYI
jgi:hypothetical protein